MEENGGVIFPPAEQAAAMAATTETATVTVVERTDEKVSETAEATKAVIERIDEKVSEAMKTVVEDTVVCKAEAAVVERIAAAAAGDCREEEPSGQGGGDAASAEVVAGIMATAAATAATTGAAGLGGSKKKRGRPRKYAPDGSLARPLNHKHPKPLLAPAPVEEYTPATAVVAVMKFGRGRSVEQYTPAQYSVQLESAGSLYGKMMACSNGANFTSHILTIDSGEDITMKIICFSQQGPRAICILSANGIISNVTLRQPASFGGTMTYEGHFQLLSLSGSFIPSETGGRRSRSGGMSVSLARPDGQVIGGGVAGLLIAASPVQVVLGSFLPSYELEQEVKKAKLETALVPLPVLPVPNSGTKVEVALCNSQTQRSPTISKPNLTTSSFRIRNWSAPIPSAPFPDVPNTRSSVLA
ncbi:AT-hook motif nuclear-localized protein 1-like [Zingiber officinale]|uniref:AT-hook motif nuclear-localized protein n=1 Tax=Zingiber officinale TaxID=94328 RepID=A0A8J5F5A1_ZINOF|nr:AT-hook motif nuclear-localized protein 1-like [Zingiber officinale]KAG6478838.1 hypothetical protein ZIOFF_062283 [Zingiber officinale]